MRIAYVSHVDSRWIKQRPHFLAEALEDAETRVTFVCSLFVQSKRLVAGQRLRVPVLRVPMLPQRLRGRIGFLDPIGAWVSALLILLVVRPTHVIFTHSRHHHLADLLRKAGVHVYYDCMDLNGNFADVQSSDSRDESRLVSASEVVFCSSHEITRHIGRMSDGATTVVVANALHPPAFEGRHEGLVNKVVPRTVGYVGAISAWFDFEAISAIVDSQKDVSVVLWGPVDVPIPSHERIIHRGVLPHDEAVSAMHSCSVLILPFLVTDLVRAVDPVKVYEYIATGRPVLVRDYPQLAHFGDFVDRYSDIPELIDRLGDVLNAPAMPSAARREFMASNSWSVRASTMKAWLK